MYLPAVGMMFVAYSCLMKNKTLKTVDLTEVDNCDAIEVCELIHLFYIYVQHFMIIITH